MPGFERQAVGIVLVGRKARPAAGAHGKELGDQESAYAIPVLAPRICLILRCVLVSSEPYCTTSMSAALTAKGAMLSIETRPGDEDLGGIGGADEACHSTLRNIDAFGLTIPDISAAIADHERSPATSTSSVPVAGTTLVS